MKQQPFGWVIVILIVLLSTTLSCEKKGVEKVVTPKKTIEDTPENRHQAALRYHKIFPYEENFNNMMDGMFGAMSEAGAEHANAMRKMMFKSLDMKALEEASVEAMAKNFTAAEITALADFYSTPEGAAVMKKMPKYMADLMPIIQRQIMSNFPSTMMGGLDEEISKSVEEARKDIDRMMKEHLGDEESPATETEEESPDSNDAGEEQRKQ